MNCKGKQVVVYSKLEGSRLERMFCKGKDKEIVRIDWIEDVYDLFKLKNLLLRWIFSTIIVENSVFFLSQIWPKRANKHNQENSSCHNFQVSYFQDSKTKIFLYSFRSFYIPSLFVYSLSDYRDLLPFSFHLFSH